MHDETGSAVRINPEHSMMEYRLEKIETSSQLISRSHGKNILKYFSFKVNCTSKYSSNLNSILPRHHVGMLYYISEIKQKQNKGKTKRIR